MIITAFEPEVPGYQMACVEYKFRLDRNGSDERKHHPFTSQFVGVATVTAPGSRLRNQAGLWGRFGEGSSVNDIVTSCLSPKEGPQEFSGQGWGF